MTSHEHLTFMFTDIVGSTALFSSVSPQEAFRLRQSHFQALERALAGSGGQIVTNLGDGAMVVFGSCSEAMRAAVLLQQILLADQRVTSERIELRVGLSTGDVRREGDDYFGDAVVEAARLCALADSGEILVTSKVRVIAGRFASESTESIGPMTLKGLPEPVEVERVRWEQAPPLEFPLPARLRRQVDFFGRETELAHLEEAFKAASVQGPRVTLCAGEAGIGKTTMAVEFALSAHARGAIVLLGRCDEHLRVPFQPFEEALSHFVAHAPDHLLALALQSRGSELLRLVPVLESRLTERQRATLDDPKGDAHALHRAVASLLSASSTAQTVVLILEDLHWADEDSLQLLRHLATELDGARLLIVGTYRSTSLAASHPLTGFLGSLARDGTATRLELAGWDGGDITALLQREQGGALGDDVVRIAELVAADTGGIPFFVSEMLRHLSSSGVLRREDDGRYSAAVPAAQLSLPATVREVLADRIRSVGDDGLEVLQTAAAIGREFPFDLLQHSTGLSEEAVLQTLEDATVAGLVREVPPEPASGETVFSFHQGLIRTALLDSIGGGRRRLLHRRIAEALEDMQRAGRSVAPADLAHHYTAAGNEHLAKRIHYSVLAANDALARLAPQDAVKHLAAALAAHDQLAGTEPSERLDLLISLGVAQRLAAAGDYRSTLLDAAHLAIALQDGSRLVRAALENTRGFSSRVGTIDAELVEVLEQALAWSPEASADRALALSALCSELQYDSNPELRLALSQEADEICAALGDDLLTVTVTNRMFSEMMGSHRLVDYLQRSESNLRAAERVGDGTQLFWARVWRVYALRSSGMMREADELLARASTLATELDQPLLSWWSTNVAAVGAWIAGDPAEVDRLAHEGEQIGVRSGQVDAPVLAYTLRGGAAWLRGELHDLIPLIEAAIADQGDDALVNALVLARAEADDIEGCRSMLRDMPDRMAAFRSTFLFVVTGAIYAEAVLRAGDAGGAEHLFELLRPHDDELAHTGASVLGPVSHFLGGLATVLGRYDEADEWYQQAAVTNDGMGARFFAARTALDHAGMLALRGADPDLERASALLETASSLAELGGYAVVARRAAAVRATLRAGAPERSGA